MRQKCCGVYFSPIALFPDYFVGVLSKERVCEYFILPIANCLLTQRAVQNQLKVLWSILFIVFAHLLHFLLAMTLSVFPTKSHELLAFFVFLELSLQVQTVREELAAWTMVIMVMSMMKTIYIVYRFCSPHALFPDHGIGSFSNKVNLL